MTTIEETIFQAKMQDETIEEESLLEKEIVKLIDSALKERLIELGMDDIKVIAKELLPDFDRMISNRVKTHFYEIGSFLVGKFGGMDEGE